jgi:hypothetical protein
MRHLISYGGSRVGRDNQSEIMASHQGLLTKLGWFVYILGWLAGCTAAGRSIFILIIPSPSRATVAYQMSPIMIHHFQFFFGDSEAPQPVSYTGKQVPEAQHAAANVFTLLSLPPAALTSLWAPYI